MKKRQFVTVILLGGFMCVFAAHGEERPQRPQLVDIEKTKDLLCQALTQEDRQLVVAKVISWDEAAKALDFDTGLDKHENLAQKGYCFTFFKVTEAITRSDKVFFYAASPTWWWNGVVHPDTHDEVFVPAVGTPWLLVTQPVAGNADKGIPRIDLPDVNNGAVEVKDDNRLKVDIASLIADLKTIRDRDRNKKTQRLELKTEFASVVRGY